MNGTSKAGLTLAVAAAGLFLAGCSTAPYSSASAGPVHCAGINSCKGTSACKTANNACKGQNACKGTGFLEKTAEECKAAGGKVTS